MKKNIKKIFVLVLTIILMSIYTYSFADVGSFDRYDSGSSDWGSSSSSWDWDDDYSYSSSSSGGDLSFLIGLLLGSRPRKNFNIGNYNYFIYNL